MTQPAILSAWNRQYDHIPIGTVIPYAGVVLPSPKWMWCNGDPITQADYPALFAIIGPGPNLPTFNSAERFVIGSSSTNTTYTPAGPSAGVLNYSVTLTEQNIPSFVIDYNGSSWSASLPHTGLTNGDETVCNDTTGNWIQYYSSGAHQSNDITFQDLSSFELYYKLGGVATPIVGTVNTTDSVLPSISISYIIKAL